MHACMSNICMYVCMYVCMHVGRHAHPVYVYTYTHIYTYMYIVYMYIWMYLYMGYVSVLVYWACIYIYIPLSGYVHMCVHIQSCGGRERERERERPQALKGGIPPTGVLLSQWRDPHVLRQHSSQHSNVRHEPTQRSLGNLIRPNGPRRSLMDPSWP